MEYYDEINIASTCRKLSLLLYASCTNEKLSKYDLYCKKCSLTNKTCCGSNFDKSLSLINAKY